MLRILVFALLLLTNPAFAAVAPYTDVWFDSNEPGWGVFVTQSNTFQFMAFFIYGADGKPTWYTAQLNDDGTGNYSGTLYATQLTRALGTSTLPHALEQADGGRCRRV